VRIIIVRFPYYKGERGKEAAIEAEDFWGQAEEACDMDPIGRWATSRRADATGWKIEPVRRWI